MYIYYCHYCQNCEFKIFVKEQIRHKLMAFEGEAKSSKVRYQDIFSYLESRVESRENLLINKIITIMSYSKVKKYGFPVFEDMDHYWAYYVVRVREADLRFR